MLLEFTVTPVGKGESLSEDVSKVLDLVDKSALPYKAGPMGTVVEGEWDELMALVKKCHEAVRGQGNRVVTTMKIDDNLSKGPGRIDGKVASVEAKLGRKLKK